MIIQTKNMYKYIDAEKKLPILSDINVEIQEGEFVSIMGPSGSGKSTLLGILAGIDSATQGSVYIEEQDITKLSEKQICKFRNKNIGMVLQAPNLIETITALENVEMPFVFSKVSADIKRAKDLLKIMGLGDKEKCYPKQLSGGEAQRVAIARALSCSPKIIMADEPTGALDSKNGKLVIDIFKDIVKKDKVTIVMVTHDLKLAQKTDRIIYIEDGRICNV